MRVLVAFDKFKDAMGAPGACETAAGALRAIHPDWLVETCPLTDGGEGFAEILTAAAAGLCESRSVTGPRGAPVEAVFGRVPVARIPAGARAMLALDARAAAPDAKIAVIEMAAASGLALLAESDRDPWQTTTAGTGELIRAAADSAGILLGVGGSATNDLGLGALGALGLEFLSAEGRAGVPPCPAAWPRIARLRGGPSAALPPVRIACDVTNPLLGPRGAAAVYGPQKGLRPGDLARLEQESARIGLMACAHFGRSDRLMDTPGAGAAGGLPFGLLTALPVLLLPGFELVSTWLDLDARIAAADLVVTGEGCFDASSLSGKGPGAIALRARARGKPVHVFAGKVSAPPAEGLAVHALTPDGMPLAEALHRTPVHLAAAIARVFPRERP